MESGKIDLMSIFLSKFLPLFVYPLGIASVIIVLSIFIQRFRRLQRILLIAAFIILWVGGNRWLAYSLMRSLEWQYLPDKILPTADAIVVLGGGTEAADYPRQTVEVNGAGDRVIFAAQLYKQGKSPHILLSGGNIAFLSSTSHKEAEDMRDLLLLMDIPQDAIWIETQSRNTYENAVFSKHILQEKNIQRILLVTSALHMPRSVSLFEKQGVDVIPAPADFTVTQQGWQHLLEPNLETQIINLFPNTSNLSLTTKAMKEYLGIFYYKVRGFL
jgi:uncharacterized SAM-binding protein YcdF (DUF218 family)